MAYKKTWTKAPIVRSPRLIREWSDNQKVIFEDVASGTGNTQVDSYAGTGKSTTIVESFYHMKPGTSALMCAFAKVNQIDLEKKAPATVSPLTFHGLGNRAVRRAFPNMSKVIDDKGEKLEGFIRAERGDDAETTELRFNLSKAVQLCKGYLALTPEGIDPILDRHEIDTCGESREGFITSIMRVLNGCKNDTSRIDFDDMIFFPNVHNIKLDQYGMVFIDEAQDLNLAQINIALNSCQPNGRVVSVGDERQAIYSFRGADSNAIQNIVDRCNSKRLSLSVTYRCAKSIVAMANQVVPELEAAPSSPEGMVDYIPESHIEKLVRPGDFILSRTNAPLIGMCLAMLKAHIPANIQGRDLGKSLLSMIKKSKARDVDSFLGWLGEWRNLEVDRLVKAKRDSSVVEDKAECLRVLCEGAKEVSELKSNIDKLFYDGDDKNRVILSTTHKAKGLERDRVFMLSKTYKRGKSTEEDNLWYVACTRAKSELYMVT